MTTLAIEDYHVGIVCALDSEMAAVEAMLDEEHEIAVTQDTHDHNTYSVGRMHSHNVVIACLPAGIDGLTAAATVAKDMSRTFSQLRFALLVGIGGGIPDLEHGIDIRLGDIVVSEPTNTTGGVVQYDKGKTKTEGAWERKGTLNAPPTVLLTALQKLKARHLRYDSKVPSLVADMFQRYSKMVETGYTFPGRHQDCLRFTGRSIVDGKASHGPVVDSGAVPRPARMTDDPKIHYGVIASGNRVIKDAAVRDFLRQDCGALCVEMEAAGLMNEFPCLVIRGICDYADAYKNDRWHRYAAAVAAAYAKELLSYVSAEQTDQEQPVQQILGTLNEHFQQVYVHHARQEEHFNQQAAQRLEEKLRKCHQAFKTSSYEEQKNINPDRAPGTCRWLLDHPQYLRWRESQHSDLLWISADPGCGKSVLSKSLVDYELRGDGSDPGAIICYFFFKDNDVQDSLATALCAILHQLFDQQPQLIPCALAALDKDGSRISAEVDELWRILQTAASDQHLRRRVVCVLDALDECRDTDRRRLVSMLCQFYNNIDRTSSRKKELKFIVTSRPYHDIEYHFGRIATSLPSIRLRGEDENDTIRLEIDSVVRTQVQEITKDFQLAPATAKSLEQRLLAMEHRTYLWLHLASQSIRETFLHSLRPDKESIELLPDSVDGAYEQILSKVDQKQIRQVRTILNIILGARRPLTVEEMALSLDVATLEAVPRSFSDLTVKEDQLASRIRHWCGLFVFINHSRLYLIHQTAKEFLLRDPRQPWTDDGRWKHCLSVTGIDREMVRIYVSYMCLEEFEAEHDDMFDDCCSQQQVDARKELFELAAESWADHWHSVEATAGSVEKDQVWMLYKQQNRRFLRWTEVLLRAKRPNENNLHMNNLMVAALLGHESVIRRIVTAGLVDLDARDSRECTALMRAAEMGHLTVVASLLDSGADINASGYSGSALQTASKKGHERVVQLLLDKGANIEAQEGDYSGSALQLASETGSEGVVQLLLDKGANVNAQGGAFGTALQTAAINGHERVVQLLLDNGADINAQGGPFGNALQVASERGCEKVVQLLLNRGADVNAQGGLYGSALQTAAVKGHERVVQLLLDNGADVNAQGGPLGNALQLALERGCEEIVKLLLGAKAAVALPNPITLKRTFPYEDRDTSEELTRTKRAQLSPPEQG